MFFAQPWLLRALCVSCVGHYYSVLKLLGNKFKHISCCVQSYVCHTLASIIQFSLQHSNSSTLCTLSHINFNTSRKGCFRFFDTFAFFHMQKWRIKQKWSNLLSFWDSQLAKISILSTQESSEAKPKYQKIRKIFF